MEYQEDLDFWNDLIGKRFKFTNLFTYHGALFPNVQKTISEWLNLNLIFHRSNQNKYYNWVDTIFFIISMEVPQ